MSTTKSKTRKRKLNKVGSHTLNHLSPKRRKLSSGKKKNINPQKSKTKKQKKSQQIPHSIRDTQIVPYTLSELEHLTVIELKELLKRQNFPITGHKSTLIERLTKPKQTINQMKLSYHQQFNNDSNDLPNYRVNVYKDTPLWFVEEQERLTKKMEFKAENYVFIDGRIKYKSTLN